MQPYIRAALTITGRPPGLVLHNGALSDDTSKIRQLIDELVDAGRGRKHRTEEQDDRLNLLRWKGALYLDEDGRIVLPAINLFKSIVVAARELSLGTKIEDRGAVTIEETELPLGYDGPADLDQLYQDTKYRLRIPVNPNPTSRTKTLLPMMRPVFPQWQAEARVLVLTEMIDWAKFLQVLDLAGNVGVGNARKIGYGRYDVKVTKL